ncbi:MAG TPA: response regulator [Campylobacterales bacterium]|nr:response regulator [Campylobacterales bacterium]
MRFLVVDDSKVSRLKIINLIKELGFDAIGEAGDGVEAVQKFVELKPDVITMDYEMPNLDGSEASKQILALNKDAKIILVTSMIGKKETLAALKTGVKKILQKPITLDDLSTAITEIE